jgi:hypothetical protein
MAKRKLTGLDKLFSQQQKLIDAVDPPAIRQMRKFTEALRGRSLVLDKAHGLASTTQAFDSINRLALDSQRMRDLSDPPHLRRLHESMKAAAGYAAAHDVIHKLTGSSKIDACTQLLGAGGSAIEGIFRQSQLFRAADNVRLACAGIPKLTFALAEGISEPTTELLWLGAQFIDSPIDDFAPSIVAEVTPEIFRALDLERSLSGEPTESVVDERTKLASATADEVMSRLEELDPQLPELLRGARSAPRANTHDTARHVCVSLRELLGHVLHRLAPDVEIRAWSQDSHHYHNGNPTRRARMLYLYERIQGPPLQKFIEADVRAALELFDALSSGTHVPVFCVSDEGLACLAHRAEGLLLTFLKLGKVRQSGN